MASQGASGNPWMPKLTLESYINLEQTDVVSIEELRKILMMHGFKSLNIPKIYLMDAVRSVELIDAQRSTLQSDISSKAFLTLTDVIKDISLLNWNECCITSMETINSVNDFDNEAVEKSSAKRLKPDCIKPVHKAQCYTTSDTTEYYNSPSDTAQYYNSPSDTAQYYNSPSETAQYYNKISDTAHYDRKRPAASTKKMAQSEYSVNRDRPLRISKTPARYQN